MKRYTTLARSMAIILLIALTNSLDSQAQSTIIAKFIVQDARMNDVDIAKQWIKEGAYLAIYTDEESDDLHFANVNPKQDTQSYGNIFELKTKKIEATNDNYETEIFTFKWSYENSYDDKVGTATVRLVKVRKKAGVAFTCTLIPENLDVIVYKGYMEGSLKALN